MKITAVLLAAGLSSRMGENKLFLPYQGKFLVEYTMSLLATLPFFQRVIILNEDNANKIAPSDDFIVAINSHPERGQSGSVRLGAQLAQGDAVLFCTGDQPFLDEKSIKTILHHAAPDRIVIPTHQGRRGHPVCFGHRFIPELLALSGEEGGKPILRAHPECCAFVEIENARALIDIDTKQEYEALLRGEI